jgi:hypothetical protein
LREQDEKRKGEHAAVVEDLEEIKEKTMDTWGLIGMFEVLILRPRVMPRVLKVTVFPHQMKRLLRFVTDKMRL